jgi:hypothetical protein
MNEDSIQVTYEAFLVGTRIPFRFSVLLYVDGLPTGISATVWLRKRATAVMHHMVDHGNELLNQHGVAMELAAQVYAQRREKAMAQVQVGDRVKLLVDIGQYKKGRVCKIMEICEPSSYEPRGGYAWVDDRFPVKVAPIRAATDSISLGPKDWLPLAQGEFGPLDQEVDG